MKKPIKKTKVVISMPGYRLEGILSVTEGVRPSDFINSHEQLFISLTDCKVYDWQGKFLEDKDFIVVNKERISWVAEM